ncbi:MAG: site-specific integrase [Actinomycetota bacterium]|nr:site-specific integrase [Actinomycetota bacterium]
MARRNRGLGAVFLRADGRWEGQIRIGGGRRRSFYAHTRRDLVHKLADARWALGEGLPVSAGTQSLRAYLEYWLMVCRTRLRPITLVTYGRDVRRLTAVLGDVPLRNLTPGLVQSSYAALLDQGFSKRTVEKTHAVLHRAMDQAMHWGLTARNPTELVNPPRPVRREMTALTGSQLAQLLRVTEGSRWYPLWVLLGTSGLRVGEALGLLWKDVDMDAGRLAVRHTLQRQPGRGFVLGPTKTEKSRRTVYLSGFARKALEQQRERQDRAQRVSRRWLDTGLVFTNQNGEAVGPGGVNRALDEALQNAGLPHVRVHDLRHTTASLLLEAGTHPKVVQDLLGHSTIQLTLDTYSHVTPALHQQAARTMDVLLSPRASYGAYAGL